MNIKELFNELDPVTAIEFKNYVVENLSRICCNKDANSKVVSSQRDGELYCEKCHCRFNKNGKTKSGVQKYICPKCKKTISETTDTTIYHSKVSFEIWSNVIDNLLDGFSIRRIAEENNISVSTSFRLRHKVLLALQNFIDEIKLVGKVQADEKYFSINLKGTKPNNMPRYSKKRTTTNAQYRGINHHKVCVTSGIDENDNLVLQIAGLGRCTTQMLENSLGQKMSKSNLITADSASAYQSFCDNHDLILLSVPSGVHSDGEINISEINGVHSQLETWFSKFRGVSIRHLQEYLNWFTYIFTMKKKFSLSKIKIESYRNIVFDNNYINSKGIFSMDFSVDLNIAYAEYAHQS